MNYELKNQLEELGNKIDELQAQIKELKGSQKNTTSDETLRNTLLSLERIDNGYLVVIPYELEEGVYRSDRIAVTCEDFDPFHFDEGHAELMRDLFWQIADALGYYPKAKFGHHYLEITAKKENIDFPCNPAKSMI